MRRSVWSVQDAKAHFSELIDAALEGRPQRVTRHGKQAVVVVSAADFDAVERREGSLVEFFAASPYRGVDIGVRRSKAGGRKIDL